MRILGVDPGSRVTGWGLVGGSPARPELIDCGVIRLPVREPFPERLHHLRRELEKMVRKVSPTSVAVEWPFHGTNARSALQLAHARGVILAVLAGAGVPVTEYSPATIKKAVTGNGRADKGQVRAMVRRLLRAEAIGSLDRADALAVALCHAHSLAYRAAVDRAATRGAGRRGADGAAVSRRARAQRGVTPRRAP